MQKSLKKFPEIEREVPLALFSSFGTGGKADYFLRAKKLKLLIRVLEEAKEARIPLFIFGGGTNIIFPDEGLQGLVIKNECQEINFFREHVTVDSGFRLPSLVSMTIEKKLSGLENLFGIPGTVGGAIFGNAGAFGNEICKTVIEVEVFSRDGFQKVIFDSKKDSSYRSSRFKQNREIILRIKFNLKKSSYEVITDKKIIEIRKRQQYRGTVGSFFKNPNSDLSAGELLDKIGAKKIQVGGAGVLSSHANFLVNRGSATSEDILSLAKKLQGKVQEKFDITLEPEVNIMRNGEGYFGS